MCFVSDVVDVQNKYDVNNIGLHLFINLAIIGFLFSISLFQVQDL